MPLTTVCHCRRDKCDVYIGRPGPWGNPFKMNNRSMEERLRVIAQYRAWILTQPALLAQVHTLRGKKLGCWCSPLPCHGSVLAELSHMQPWEIAVLVATAPPTIPPRLTARPGGKEMTDREARDTIGLILGENSPASGCRLEGSFQGQRLQALRHAWTILNHRINRAAEKQRAGKPQDERTGNPKG